MTPPTWPVRRDASAPWRERQAWLTDVLRSENGTEARLAVRGVPRRFAAFHCTALTERAAQQLAALVEANHANTWTVPDWHLAAAPETARVGRLTDVAGLRRQLLTTRHAALAVEFELALEAPVAAAAAPATFLTYELVTVVPWRVQEPEETLARAVDRLESPAGVYELHDPVGVSSRHLSVRWLLQGTAAIAAAEAFLRRRQGRRHAFWLPSWHRDFRLVADAAADATTLAIAHVGYTASLFPDRSRRFLALITPDRVVTPVEVTAAESDGVTELLTLAGPVGHAAAARHAIVAQLLWVRLASDEQTIERRGLALAELTLDVVEVRNEGPVKLPEPPVDTGGDGDPGDELNDLPDFMVLVTSLATRMEFIVDNAVNYTTVEYKLDDGAAEGAWAPCPLAPDFLTVYRNLFGGADKTLTIRAIGPAGEKVRTFTIAPRSFEGTPPPDYVVEFTAFTVGTPDPLTDTIPLAWESTALPVAPGGVHIQWRYQETPDDVYETSVVTSPWTHERYAPAETPHGLDLIAASQADPENPPETAHLEYRAIARDENGILCGQTDWQARSVLYQPYVPPVGP